MDSSIQSSFNILDGYASLPDLLRSAPRAQQTHAGAVKASREFEEVGLVVDRQQRFSTTNVSIVSILDSATSPTDGCRHDGVEVRSHDELFQNHYPNN